MKDQIFIFVCRLSRCCLIFTGFAILTLVLVNAEAAPKRVLLLKSMTVPITELHLAAFRRALQQAKSVQEGVDYVIDEIDAGGRLGNLAQAVEQYLAQHERPDFVMTSATLASKYAHQHLVSQGIPMMFITVAQPVKAGLVRTIGQPSGNDITGVSHSVSLRTRLDYVLDLAQLIYGRRQGLRLGYVHTDYPSELDEVSQLTSVARSLGIEVLSQQLTYRPDDVSTMAEEMGRGIKRLDTQVDFFWTPVGPSSSLADVLLTYRHSATKPILYAASRTALKYGAILQIDPHPNAIGRAAAERFLLLLRGADAGTIPAVVPQGVQFGLNLNAADQHGLRIPFRFIQQAGGNLIKR